MLKWSLIQALNQLKLLLFFDSETVKFRHPVSKRQYESFSGVKRESVFLTALCNYLKLIVYFKGGSKLSLYWNGVQC